MKFTYSAFNSIAIALAVLLAARTLQPMVDHSLEWPLVIIMVGIAAAVGLLGAVLDAPRIITLGVQGITLVVILVAMATLINPVDPEVETSLPSRLQELGTQGIQTVQGNAAPLPMDPGLMWLVLVALALVLLLTELLVNGLEQPAWSIAPLGVPYGIGAIALQDEMLATDFVTMVVGYALVLLAATGFLNHRMGNSGERVAFAVSRVVAALVALALAAGVTMAVTPMLPMGAKRPWLATDPSRPIELGDPTVTLNENLQRPAEERVLRYTTSTGQPTYLRTVALTKLTTGGAVLTPMRLSTSDLSGAYEHPGSELEVEVEMDFGSEYLPVPFVVDDFSADGQWAFDRETMSIIATGEARTDQTRELNYSVSSVVPDPEHASVAQATAGTDPAGTETLEVPEGLAPGVRELVDQLTDGVDSDGAAAQAIQRFLRSDQFTYSLEAPQSTNLDTLSTFLLEQNQGYCIHFAAGMVTMARMAGIPARMAIGFTPGSADGDGWVVTTHNMHAWPELYFEDLGWVPFEPSPAVAGPPDWTDPDEVGPDEAPESPSPEPTEPDATPSPPAPEMPEEPTMEPTAAPADPGDAGDEPGSRVGWIVLFSVVAAALLPAGFRLLQRWWRLRPDQPIGVATERAWAEVRSSIHDARIPWPAAASPVLTSHKLHRAVSDDVSESLESIAVTVERSRYARETVEVSDLPEQVRTMRSQLDTQLSGDAFVARFLPSSLLPRRFRV